MTSRSRVWYRSIILGSATLASVGLAGYLGYKAGVKKGVQQAFYCHAIHAQGYTSALRALRTGDTERGLWMLEVSLDSAIVLMAPTDDFLESRTERAVDDTLLKVKEYRTAYPRASHADADAIVDKILSRSGGAK
jgi:hypothetical protein